MLLLQDCVLLSHLLQKSLYPEQNTSVSRSKLGQDDVSCHKCDFDDTTFDHTPDARMHGVLLCFRSQSTAFDALEGLNIVINYR